MKQPADSIHPHEPPRVALAQLPTPIVSLNNLSRHLGVDSILLKRDDLTGIELTGNKIRKLEYLLADAVSKGCDALVTHGGYQSNSCRAAAAAGARLGLHVRMIIRTPAADVRPAEGNLLLDQLFGAELSFHPIDEYTARRDELIADAMQAQRDAGRRPYFFPVGGSNAIGSWGYIRCVHELMRQLPADQPVDVFVAVSSSGTLAGLALGQALLGAKNLRIVGVPVSDNLELFRPDVSAIIAATIDQFSLPVRMSAIAIELVDGFIGAGYAIPTPASAEALSLIARTEGVLLDPTYTAKAMAGFLHAIAEGKIRRGATPMFIHTGGVFGLMARRELFADK